MTLDHFSAAGRLAFPAGTDTVAAVHAYAHRRGMTVHEALAELIHAALAAAAAKETP